MPHPKLCRAGESARAVSRPLLATAVLVVIVSFGISLGTAFSQDAHDQPAQDQSGQGMGRHMGRRQMPSVDDQLQHMTKKLNLSDDQKAKLKPILEDQRRQMEQVRNDSSLSREDRFSKMRELRESRDSQIKQVLNEDQQKKFDKLQQDQRGHVRRRGGGDNAGPHGGSGEQPQQ